MPEVIQAPKGGFLTVSRTTDRTLVFPTWPRWALALLTVGSLTFDGGGLFVWSITVPDTLKNREALAKAPREVFASNDAIGGTRSDIFVTPNELTVSVSAGDPWSLWAPALTAFAPNAPALSTLFDTEEEIAFSDLIPTPNDLLPSARLLKQGELALPQLVPGRVLDPDEGDADAPPTPRPFLRQEYPNLFPDALEAF